MKILVVIPAYYPALDFGGPVPVARDLAQRFSRRGHEVTVWTTNLYTRTKKLGDKSEEREVDGVRVVYFNSVLRYRWVGITPDVFRSLQREGQSYDVIHIYGYREFLTLAVAAWARRNRIPYVLQSMGTVGRMSRSMLKKLLYDSLFGARILKGASALIAKTPLERDQYLQAGIAAEKVSIVPNGMDIPEELSSLRRGEFRRAHGLSVERPLVLFLGRIHPVKGVEMLVRAFSKLDAAGQLAVVGPDEGPRVELERMVRDAGKESQVVFTGPLYDEEKWAAYLDADVYVLPSAFENFPRSVLEAMSAKTPVILTDRCGIAEMVQGYGGLVVPYEEDALVEAMRRMVGDADLRVQMASRAFESLTERFSWEPIVDELEALYEAVTKHKVEGK